MIFFIDILPPELLMDRFIDSYGINKNFILRDAYNS